MSVANLGAVDQDRIDRQLRLIAEVTREHRDARHAAQAQGRRRLQAR
ncbi:MAG TPA: hypothetical protein VGJ45_37915 [Pseudonocardiaceae bacterium]